MRLSAVFAALLALATPAAAAAPGIADQAQAAYSVFAGGLSQQAYLNAQYGKGVFRAIAGKWVRLNGPVNKSGVETYGVDTDKFCKSPAALTLASSDPRKLTVTSNFPRDNFSQEYVLIAGATFGEYTDPESYLKAVGLGPERAGDAADQQRALLLSLANGIVQFYRPSEDILVMTRDRGYPVIFARCPAE